MENIVRLPVMTLLSLLEQATAADARGSTIRICTGRDKNGNWVKWDAGYGWTPPYYSLPY